MIFESAINVIGLLGIGGVIGTYLRIVWERRDKALSQMQEFKFARYKCIIILMHAALNFEQRNPHLRQVGRNFQTKEELIEEIEMEWHNSILFASDEALKSIHAFLNQPSSSLFKQSVIAMRQDLWGNKLSKDLELLDF